MTNKINGIDVSECKHHYTNPVNGIIYHGCAIYEQINELGYSQDTLCEQNPDCYFKQFKRLQEENKSLQMLSCANCGEKYLTPDGAELYDKNVQLQKENEELKARLKTLDDEVITIEITPDEFERYKKYKQEIEAKEIIAELEYKNKDYLKQLDALKPENVYLHKTIKKYEQTLKEIKEISEPIKKDICNNCGWQDSDCCEPEGCDCNEFITILHKINEVINEK